MKLPISRVAGVEVLKAAGLPTARCLGFTVEFEPDSLVVIHARYTADDLTIDAVKRAVAPGSADPTQPADPESPASRY